jgi:hypothetical protein
VAAFSHGCRNNAAKIYAWLLQVNAVPPSDVHGIVEAMAAQCKPRLDRSAVKKAIEYAKKMRRMRDQTISHWLGVTVEESEMLEGLPPATRLRPVNDTPPALRPRELHLVAIQQRRAAIQAVISEQGFVLPVREMGTLLKAKPHSGNHQTVFKDYKALGIEWDRTRQAIAARHQLFDQPRLLSQDAEKLLNMLQKHVTRGMF